MNTVIPVWPAPAVAVAGASAVFPARRIYCVGRNYAAHAREMGADPTREAPFFFTKPADALVMSGATIPYPPATTNLHHEIELVVALKGGGAAVATDRALDLVFGYAVGLDMTRRDLQNAAKAAGKPWDMGKGFDRSAPISPIAPAAAIGHPREGAIWVKVNGVTKQTGDLSDLIWSVPETIAYLSGLVELAPGDLIYTGTPEGVGPVVAGDLVEGHIDGVGDLTIRYA
ncbi:MAG TPA: fumarylacetoacetate hydrolase family protein [Vicinamibacterales bacterium]|nr:fumarylacetoacetate hydrolase family protein [Vicinamibacterales bacterium]